MLFGTCCESRHPDSTCVCCPGNTSGVSNRWVATLVSWLSNTGAALGEARAVVPKQPFYKYSSSWTYTRFYTWFEQVFNPVWGPGLKQKTKSYWTIWILRNSLWALRADFQERKHALGISPALVFPLLANRRRAFFFRMTLTPIRTADSRARHKPSHRL